MDDNETVFKELAVNPRAGEFMTDRQQLISSLISNLRPICQEILVLFYYQNLSMKEIAERQNYRSANVAKVMKARCMESLRKLAKGK